MQGFKMYKQGKEKQKTKSGFKNRSRRTYIWGVN